MPVNSIGCHYSGSDNDGEGEIVLAWHGSNYDNLWVKTCKYYWYEKTWGPVEHLENNWHLFKKSGRLEPLNYVSKNV